MRLNDLDKLVIVDKDLVSGIFLTFLFSYNSILYPRMIEGGIRERQNEIQQTNIIVILFGGAASISDLYVLE